MTCKYSFIVATLGRKKELDILLGSLARQTIEKSLFEVIIVDQNDTDILSELINHYSTKLTIKYIKSERKGLSYNRNLGIKFSSGIYLSVPDDDCEYYDDTIKNIDQQLERFSHPDMIVGRVYNRKEGKHVFKKTPNKSYEVTYYNFYSIVSSISLVFKKNSILFDENFGIGEKYHSNEDGELILHFLKQHKKIIYSPLVEFNHPPYDSNNMSLDKLYKYGIGFGALCKKYFSFPLLVLYIKVISFQFMMTLKELILFNLPEANRRMYALKGRLKGFSLYIRN